MKVHQTPDEKNTPLYDEIAKSMEGSGVLFRLRASRRTKPIINWSWKAKKL